MSELKENLGEVDVKGKCPECNQMTTFEIGHSTGCEDCGEHLAVKCIECGEYFDCVWGYDKILEFNGIDE